MQVIGIDPGLNGFVACVENADTVLWTAATPTISTGKKRQYDICKMVGLIEDDLVYSFPDMVIIEKQQAMPKQGVSSTFRTGVGFGLWEGIIAALGLPYRVVHPRTWQRIAHRDILGNDPKGRSIIAARRLFPNVDLRRTEKCIKPDHNKADAILLAWYGFQSND